MANWDKLGGLSGNVEDRRGMGGGATVLGGGGLIAILITLGLNFMGINVDPNTVNQVLNQVSEINQGQVKQQDQPPEFRGLDSYEKFSTTIMGSSDQVWGDIFKQNNAEYQKPKLVLFRDATQSGCGYASSAVGPHYCPSDGTIYLDETFFDQLNREYGTNMGEVAQAYVITHEVGHHVQKLTGQLDGAGQSRMQSIDTELQADCYAGIWAHSVAKTGAYEAGEIKQAMDAAAAVGDDRIQKQAGQRVNPESWTHGSSEQRQKSFTLGYETGQPGQCKDLASK